MDDANRLRFVSKLPAAGIAVPFVLALLAHISGPRPGPVAAAPAIPALAFHQYLVDLGQVTASESVFAHFDFTNRGKNDVKITELIASCGCLKPHLKKDDYKPGESGFFTLTIQTANQAAGQKEYTVTVKYLDPAPQEALVVFRVVLPDDQVLVRPIALLFYQLGEVQAADGPAAPAMTGIKPQEFEITDRRSRHLSIERIECSRREVQAEFQDDEIDDAGIWHGRFRVWIENPLPPGRRDAFVRIFTDDPDDRYRVLRVPIVMQGPSRRNLARPSRPRMIDSKVLPASGTKPTNGAAH